MPPQGRENRRSGQGQLTIPNIWPNEFAAAGPQRDLLGLHTKWRVPLFILPCFKAALHVHLNL